ncbi:MAG: SUMF1/EgtB/PvdO family nonheme iron enzyme, partial [Sedimentisphaerales bacterium]|nr:SUMF1/EgtB/PvdO family nonheme iron enzyme [Sedimentisphaerales bacterium]
MDKSIAIKVCCLSVLIVISTGWLQGGTAEKPEDGDVMVELGPNDTGEIFTVSDLYTYSGSNCTGTRTTIMAKGDPSDDVHIAPFGGTKTFYLGQCQSYTLSYMWQGKEVETDDTWDTDLSDQAGGVFESDYAGQFAIDFSSGGAESLPPLGIAQTIGGGAGHISGGGYDWITFYDTTAGGGMIERDPLGNPISPFLPDGTSVKLVIGYPVKLFKLAGHKTLSADLNGDQQVDLADFAIMAEQWLAGEEPNNDGMDWVPVNDPGVDVTGDGTPDHEGFVGMMSKYETTNAQYCAFLNAALSSGDITYSSGIVKGANGLNPGQDFALAVYYKTTDMGLSLPGSGVVNGGASRIHYDAGVFSVDGGFENHPVTGASWYGATAFCNYYGWRLPTEWEWQAAADYDGTYMYGYGSLKDAAMLNCNETIHPDGTTIVGTFGAYGYGLADITGNLWEYTASEDGWKRIVRGGGW